MSKKIHRITYCLPKLQVYVFIDPPPVLKFVKELKKVAMVKKNVHIHLVTEGFQAEG